MMKQESKGIMIKHQIKKERIPHYPYYNLSDTYSHDQEYYFLIVLQYIQESIFLCVYPFDKAMNKLPVTGMNLKSIFQRKKICTMRVLYLKYRTISSGIDIQHAQFLLGCTSGQLALIQFNGKDCKIMSKLNKTLKSQGIFSRTSSYLFGDEDSYSTYIKAPIKSFKVIPFKSDLQYCYQVGNNLIFLKNLVQNMEKSLFQIYEANNYEAFSFHYDFNVPAQKGVLSMYGCDHYYGIKDQNKKTGLIKFHHEVSSYQFLSEKRNQIAVSLSVKQVILLIDLHKFVLKRKIITEMSIRNLYYFAHKQQEYLTIMLYDNYILLLQINSQRFCKLIGHRSFIAKVGFNQQEQILVTGGMDHRLSVVKLPQIKETHWSKAVVQPNSVQLDQNGCNALRFPDIFSLGQFNNVRTNMLGYGFADFIMINNHYCLPTYDSKIIIYKYA